MNFKIIITILFALNLVFVPFSQNYNITKNPKQNFMILRQNNLNIEFNFLCKLISGQLKPTDY